jgi:hypothetical protein
MVFSIPFFAACANVFKRLLYASDQVSPLRE